MSAAFLQAQQEGLCLRYPDPIQPQRELSYEHAATLLMRATTHAQNVPFTWSYIDKPADGTVLLLFLNNQPAFPNDGIRYQESEVKYNVPLGTRDLEVSEIKFGFIPGSQDNSASRLRRRYRIVKGGNPSLVLVHYTRGPPTHIQPQLMNQPVRAYPLRNVNEPPMFVVGEKAGHKALPPGQGGVGAGTGVPGMISIGNMSMGQQQAMLAQQNSQMESLERRRERAMRERSASNAGRQPPPGQPQGRMDDDDSGDEVDQISSRTLASARYKRNHDWMNEVFIQAAFGEKNPPAPKPAYSIFSKSEIEEKTKKVEAEIEALQLQASQRHAARVRETQGGDVQMSSTFGESIAS